MSDLQAPTLSRWRRWWLDAKALAVPLAAYWGALGIGMALFLAVVVLMTNQGPQDLFLMASLVGGCAISVALGQALALLRLRTWTILAIGSVSWGALLLAAGVAIETVGEDLAGPLIILLFLGPFWALAGVWSLRTQGALLATWAPLMWLVVRILVIAENRGSAQNWFDGNKWAVWDVLTAPVLLLGVVLMLIYLVSRELHRLHRWRFGPGGPDLPRTERLDSARRSRLGIGCGGVLALAMLALVLTVATALVAPYLWRTAPEDEGDPNHQSQSQSEQPSEGKEQPNQDSQQDSGDGQGQGDGEAEEKTPQERMQEALRQGAAAVVNLLLLLLLALAILVVFGPPIRRQLLLTHLRRSFWPVPPTREIEQSWRLVELVLADHGVHRQPQETRLALAERAKAELDDMDHLPLERCAEVADRVTYGLGLRPDDSMMARRAAEMAFQTLWERLSELGKIRANYRWL